MNVFGKVGPLITKSKKRPDDWYYLNLILNHLNRKVPKTHFWKEQYLKEKFKMYLASGSEILQSILWNELFGPHKPSRMA